MSGTPSARPFARPPLRCDRCGDLLGVYEPLVALEDGGTRDTSLAAERNAPPATTYRHRACHGADRGAVTGEGPSA